MSNANNHRGYKYKDGGQCHNMVPHQFFCRGGDQSWGSLREGEARMKASPDSLPHRVVWHTYMYNVAV